MTNLSLLPCDFCGQATDALYYMKLQDGLWLERIDGSAPQPTDLHCCYNCADALEGK